MADISIQVDDFMLDGMLEIPDGASSIVLFVHGSGSSRFSQRNQYVASILNQSKIATLLFDLLTPTEEKEDEVTRGYRFNIDLLSARLGAVTKWVVMQDKTKTFTKGYFGASTGGAAAIMAASVNKSDIKAVVSRGGRPDLAGVSLAALNAPTLLIVGGHDEVVIRKNYEAIAQMTCIQKMEIVPGATHLFEEPGTLEMAAQLARDWFLKYL